MMSNNAKAILLLCGRLGEESQTEQPLQPREYNELVRWLREEKMTPADLLESNNIAPAANGSNLPRERLESLLKRGVQLGFAVESWNRANIWVVCRSDEDYPARYKSRLKDKAPPILFGVGDRSLLRGGGLAIVGSRDADSTAEDFTRDVAAWCARGGMPVISGGARGIDQIAMKSALDAGGCVVGVLAEKLLQYSVTREARRAISDDRLLLISPYHPEARFTVGTAMGRNKLIYALAEFGLVVSADLKKGGTWSGAEEELKREPGRTVFVRTTGSPPPGNKELLKLGARPFPSFSNNDAPAILLRENNASTPMTPAKDLFDYAQQAGKQPSQFRETKPTEEAPVISTEPQVSVYEVVLPIMMREMEKPITVDNLAAKLDVSKGQLQAWIKRAIGDGKVKKLNRPVRYKRV